MKFSYILAFLIALVAAGWVLSGQVGDTLGLAATDWGKPEATSVERRMAERADQERITAVRTRQSTAKEHIREVVARGRTEAKRKVTVRAELKGRIVKIVAEKGARVQRGDVLAQIALNDRQAYLDEARALVRQRELEYEAARRLRNKGYRAETQYAGSAANLDAARAMVKQMEVDIERTVIRAPFSAVVDDRYVELGDYVEPKGAIALLVDEDPFLVVAQVSEKDVGRLQLGGTGYADLITGVRVEGRIRYIATSAQPDTRTFRVELEVRNKDRSIRDGLTAELHFPTDTVRAHLISPAVLTLDDNGVIGVRCVDAAEIVAFYPVQIVGSDASGIWIDGLPDEVELIVVGQEFVRQGEKVRSMSQKAVAQTS